MARHRTRRGGQVAPRKLGDLSRVGSVLGEAQRQIGVRADTARNDVSFAKAKLGEEYATASFPKGSEEYFKVTTKPGDEEVSYGTKTGVRGYLKSMGKGKRKTRKSKKVTRKR